MQKRQDKTHATMGQILVRFLCVISVGLLCFEEAPPAVTPSPTAAPTVGPVPMPTAEPTQSPVQSDNGGILFDLPGSLITEIKTVVVPWSEVTVIGFGTRRQATAGCGDDGLVVWHAECSLRDGATGFIFVESVVLYLLSADQAACIIDFEPGVTSIDPDAPDSQVVAADLEILVKVSCASRNLSIFNSNYQEVTVVEDDVFRVTRTPACLGAQQRLAGITCLNNFDQPPRKLIEQTGSVADDGTVTATCTWENSVKDGAVPDIGRTRQVTVCTDANPN